MPRNKPTIVETEPNAETVREAQQCITEFVASLTLAAFEERCRHEHTHTSKGFNIPKAALKNITHVLQMEEPYAIRELFRTKPGFVPPYNTPPITLLAQASLDTRGTCYAAINTTIDRVIEDPVVIDYIINPLIRTGKTSEAAVKQAFLGAIRTGRGIEGDTHSQLFEALSNFLNAGQYDEIAKTATSLFCAITSTLGITFHTTASSIHRDLVTTGFYPHTQSIAQAISRENVTKIYKTAQRIEEERQGVWPVFSAHPSDLTPSRSTDNHKLEYGWGRGS